MSIRRLNKLSRYLKRGIRAVRGEDLWLKPEIKVATCKHGSDYGDWVIHPDLLDASSIVYSFGVGEDISFDLALIEHYGVTVHAFDPTPKSIAWIEQQALPAQFVFHPFGIANYDGMATFNPPSDPTYVSYSMVNQQDVRQRSVEAPVYQLQTIMDRLGHQRIDLLKMDIEGAEYEVLHNILQAPLDVEQVLVEFHHRFPGIGVAPTKEAIVSLNQHGYRIFSVSPTGEEYSFLRATV